MLRTTRAAFQQQQQQQHVQVAKPSQSGLLSTPLKPGTEQPAHQQLHRTVLQPKKQQNSENVLSPVRTIARTLMADINAATGGGGVRRRMAINNAGATPLGKDAMKKQAAESKPATQSITSTTTATSEGEDEIEYMAPPLQSTDDDFNSEYYDPLRLNADFFRSAAFSFDAFGSSHLFTVDDADVDTIMELELEPESEPSLLSEPLTPTSDIDLDVGFNFVDSEDSLPDVIGSGAGPVFGEYISSIPEPGFVPKHLLQRQLHTSVAKIASGTRRKSLISHKSRLPRRISTFGHLAAVKSMSQPPSTSAPSPVIDPR
ncbi:hypothetical protein GQ42DRAFT_164019 [Ramicandelaber brevisporus]|nr:hypothetical protein GQ42DRAFT_164019 [Ramicandelaber brevisporus]